MPDRTARNLSAMIRLDLRNIRPVLGVTTVFLALPVLLTRFLDQPYFLYVMAFIIVFQIVLRPFALDQAYRLPLLYAQLPLRRRTVIKSRYLLSLAAMVLLSGMVFASGTLKANLAWDPGAYLGAVLTPILVSLFLSLQIPLVVRFGNQAAIWAFFIIPLLILLPLTVGLIAIGSEDLSTAWNPAAIISFLSANLGLATAIGLGTSLTFLTLSYLVSARIYERQDH